MSTLGKIYHLNNTFTPTSTGTYSVTGILIVGSARYQINSISITTQTYSYTSGCSYTVSFIGGQTTYYYRTATVTISTTGGSYSWSGTSPHTTSGAPALGTFSVSRSGNTLTVLSTAESTSSIFSYLSSWSSSVATASMINLSDVGLSTGTHSLQLRGWDNTSEYIHSPLSTTLTYTQI